MSCTCTGGSRYKTAYCPTFGLPARDAMVPPIINSHEFDIVLEATPYIYQTTLSQGTNIDGCRIVYTLASSPSWLRINSETGLVRGFIPRGFEEETFDVIAENCVGFDDIRVTLTINTRPVTFYTCRWGRSLNTILTPDEVENLAGFDRRLNVGLPMEIPAGSNMEYIFIWIADFLEDPGPRIPVPTAPGRGFYVRVEATGMPATQSAMAGPPTFPNEVNGWYFADVIVDGVRGQLYRSYYPSAANQVYTIIV